MVEAPGFGKNQPRTVPMAHSSTSEPAVAFDHIRKQFSRRHPPALQDLCFEVRPREIFGLLGHNGAGKSTALGILLGLVAADAGEVRIDGIPVHSRRAEALQGVGAIFESPAFYDYLSGWENLRLLTALSGLTSTDGFAEVVSLVRLDHAIHQRVRTYSHGMRQRLALAQALLPGPRLLLLDEPTDGLDPEGIHEFRQLILRLRDERGLTILLNSHLLAEIEQMSDRFAILKQGRLIHQGSTADLAPDHTRYQIETEAAAESLAAAVVGLGGRMIDPALAEFPASMDPADILAALMNQGLRLRAFAARRRTLEDFYLEITRNA